MQCYGVSDIITDFDSTNMLLFLTIQILTNVTKSASFLDSMNTPWDTSTHWLTCARRAFPRQPFFRVSWQCAAVASIGDTETMKEFLNILELLFKTTCLSLMKIISLCNRVLLITDNYNICHWPNKANPLIKIWVLCEKAKAAYIMCFIYIYMYTGA